jgi:hypothetical protein
MIDIASGEVEDRESESVSDDRDPRRSQFCVPLAGYLSSNLSLVRKDSEPAI